MIISSNLIYSIDNNLISKFSFMEENKIILYKDDEGKVNVNVRFADEELDEEATHKKYLLVRQEGKRHVQREIDKAVKRLKNLQKGDDEERKEDQ